MWFGFIMRLFGTKKIKFYPLFREQAQDIQRAASLLVDIMRESDVDKRKDLARDVKEVESLGDKVAGRIFEELYTTGVTPFNRVDMQQLTSLMESFLDMINDTARKTVIYHPRSIDKIWIDIAESIKEDAKIVYEIINDIDSISKNSKALTQKCERIKEIEHEVDELYEYYMSNLFETEKDGIELTKYKNIVQSLEDATDKARNISECIKTIIIKY